MKKFWTTRFPTLIFFLVILASRLPLIGAGFGSDGDAWRNAVAAFRMREVGHYVASRPPGFPVFESLLVPLVPLGWVATNALAAVAGVVAVMVFMRVSRELKIPSPFWLTFAFAFSGVLWVYTTQTMDYTLGLALLLGTYWSLLNRRHFLAGLLLALAAGCRLTTATLVLPALAMLLIGRSGRQSVILFLASYVVVTVGVYIPAILHFRSVGPIPGFFWHASQMHVTFDTLPRLLRLDAVFLFGKLGSLMLALGLTSQLLFEIYRRVRRSGRKFAANRGVFPMRPRIDTGGQQANRLTPPAIVFEAGVVLVIFILYLMAPYEPEYLIPLFPFVLLLVGRLLTRRLLVITALLIASEVVIVPLFDKQGAAPGRLALEMDQRREALRVAKVLEARRPTIPTVFVVGRVATLQLHLLVPSLEREEKVWRAWIEPGVALWSPDRRRGYAALIDQSTRKVLEKEGYHIEVLRKSGRWTKRLE